MAFVKNGAYIGSEIVVGPFWAPFEENWATYYSNICGQSCIDILRS